MDVWMLFSLTHTPTYTQDVVVGVLSWLEKVSSFAVPASVSSGKFERGVFIVPPQKRPHTTLLPTRPNKSYKPRERNSSKNQKKARGIGIEGWNGTCDRYIDIKKNASGGKIRGENPQPREDDAQDPFSWSNLLLWYQEVVIFSIHGVCVCRPSFVSPLFLSTL